VRRATSYRSRETEAALDAEFKVKKIPAIGQKRTLQEGGKHVSQPGHQRGMWETGDVEKVGGNQVGRTNSLENNKKSRRKVVKISSEGRTEGETPLVGKNTCKTQ